MADVRISAKSSGRSASRCPLCSEGLLPGEPTRDCPECRVTYHATCFGELGGCGTLGCAQAKSPSGRARRADRRGRRRSPARALLLLVGCGVALGVLSLARGPEPTNFFKEMRGEGLPPPPEEALTFDPPEPVELELLVDFETASVSFTSDVRTLIASRRVLGNSQALREDPGLREWTNLRRNAARETYRKLLRAGRLGQVSRSPDEIEASLRRRVLATVSPDEREVALEVLDEVLHLADLGLPTFSPSGD